MRFPLPTPLALLLVSVCASGAEPGNSTENVMTFAPVFQLAGAILISAVVFLLPVAAVIVGWWFSQPLGAYGSEEQGDLVNRFVGAAGKFLSSPIFSLAVISLTLLGLPLYLSSQIEVSHSSIVFTAFATVSVFAHVLLIFIVKIANEVVFLIESVFDLETSTFLTAETEDHPTSVAMK